MDFGNPFQGNPFQALGNGISGLANQTGDFLKDPIKGLEQPFVSAFDAVKNALNPGGNKAPDLATPTTKTPDPAAASTTALQNQLAREANGRATATFLTGGQGLLDQPTTTSTVLLGS